MTRSGRQDLIDAVVNGEMAVSAAARQVREGRQRANLRTRVRAQMLAYAREAQAAGDDSLAEALGIFAEAMVPDRERRDRMSDDVSIGQSGDSGRVRLAWYMDRWPNPDAVRETVTGSAGAHRPAEVSFRAGRHYRARRRRTLCRAGHDDRQKRCIPAADVRRLQHAHGQTAAESGGSLHPAIGR